MNDLIYREEAKEIITDWGLRYSIYPSIMSELFEKINNQPPADTERHAHWQQVMSNCSLYECSECGRTVRHSSNINTLSINERFPYCYCGCKMDDCNYIKDR